MQCPVGRQAVFPVQPGLPGIGVGFQTVAAGGKIGMFETGMPAQTQIVTDGPGGAGDQAFTVAFAAGVSGHAGMLVIRLDEKRPVRRGHQCVEGISQCPFQQPKPGGHPVDAAVVGALSVIAVLVQREGNLLVQGTVGTAAIQVCPEHRHGAGDSGIGCVAADGTGHAAAGIIDHVRYIVAFAEFETAGRIAGPQDQARTGKGQGGTGPDGERPAGGIVPLPGGKCE